MPCYICGAPKTSVEHAPAKCFFPSNQRNNLITVDSCTLHNEETSKDDQYVRNIIAMSLGNNQFALDHFLNNCIKSLQRSRGLMITTTRNRKRVYTKAINSSILQPTYAFEIDRARIDYVLKKIGYAIFYKTYGISWQRGLLVGTEYLVNGNMQQDGIGELIKAAKADKATEAQIIFQGTNPQIFKYVFMPTDSNDINDQILRMVFYEGFEAWLIPKNGSIEPELVK